MKKLTKFTLLCTLVCASTSHAALVSRLDGQAVYDTTNNITWIANANLAASNTFGLPTNIEFRYTYNSLFNHYISDSGTMTWAASAKWVAAMNDSNYLGFTDWQIPSIVPFCDTCDSAFYQLHSELVALGNPYGDYSNGVFVNASALFVSFASNYWSTTTYPWPAYPDYYAYYFAFGDGQRHVDYNSQLFNALVFRAGDVAVVPEPGTWALLLAGLGLVGWRTRRRL